MTTHHEALEAAVLAHDKEEAAMMGEPDPWAEDRPEQEFSDRTFAMDLGIRAYLTTLAPADNGLVERLRGTYRVPITDGLGAVGSGEEPDNPKEFVRKFETPPIQHEAADTITAQAAEIERLKALLDKAVEGFEKITGEEERRSATGIYYGAPAHSAAQMWKIAHSTLTAIQEARHA